MRAVNKEAVVVVSPSLREDALEQEKREAYCRQQLMLFCVWRTEEDLRLGHQSWEDAHQYRNPRSQQQLRNFKHLVLTAEESDSEEDWMTAAVAACATMDARPDRQQDDWMAVLCAGVDDEVRVASSIWCVCEFVV